MNTIYRKTLSYIRSKVFNHEDAKDITHNSLLKAHQFRHQLKDKSKLSSWLFKIISREIWKYKTFDYCDLFDIPVYQNTNHIDLKYLISKLPPHHQDFIFLDLNGYSHDEISKITGIKNTRVMKNYLIKKMRGFV